MVNHRVQQSILKAFVNYKPVTGTVPLARRSTRKVHLNQSACMTRDQGGPGTRNFEQRLRSSTLEDVDVSFMHTHASWYLHLAANAQASQPKEDAHALCGRMLCRDEERETMR